MVKNLWKDIPLPQMYKRWATEWEEECDVCKKNEIYWRIKINENFPDWSKAPPAHPNCRCAMYKKLMIWNLEVSNIEEYIEEIWERKNPFESLIVDIFNDALLWTYSDLWPLDLLSILNFWLSTRGGWDYDIKRRKDVKSLAENWVGIFLWERVELSNLWNLLAWFNMKNNTLPSWFVRDVFLDVETNNAEIEWYWKYAEDKAQMDEYADEVWYDAWENMYSEYKKAKNKKEKAEIIKKHIQKTNPEYNKRAKEEQEYYRMLKEKIKNENKEKETNWKDKKSGTDK